MKARSGTTALVNVVGESMLFSLLDHTKVFDTVDHEILLKKNFIFLIQLVVLYVLIS